MKASYCRCDACVIRRVPLPRPGEHRPAGLRLAQRGCQWIGTSHFELFSRPSDNDQDASKRPPLRSARPWPGLIHSSCASIAGSSKTVEGCTPASTASGGASRGSVHNNAQAGNASSHHQSNGITQGVVPAHGNRAVQNSGALGLSFACRSHHSEAVERG